MTPEQEREAREAAHRAVDRVFEERRIHAQHHRGQTRTAFADELLDALGQEGHRLVPADDPPDDGRPVTVLLREMERSSAHVEVAVWAGRNPGARAKAGTLTLRADEWDELAEHLHDLEAALAFVCRGSGLVAYQRTFEIDPL